MTSSGNCGAVLTIPGVVGYGPSPNFLQKRDEGIPCLRSAVQKHDHIRLRAGGIQRQGTMVRQGKSLVERTLENAIAALFRYERDALSPVL